MKPTISLFALFCLASLAFSRPPQAPRPLQAPAATSKGCSCGGTTDDCSCKVCSCKKPQAKKTVCDCEVTRRCDCGPSCACPACHEQASKGIPFTRRSVRMVTVPYVQPAPPMGTAVPFRQTMPSLGVMPSYGAMPSFAPARQAMPSYQPAPSFSPAPSFGGGFAAPAAPGGC